MKLAIIASLLFLVSCATSIKKTNQVSLGMTKTEVMELMGEPDNTRASGKETFMVYYLSETSGSNATRALASVFTLGSSERKEKKEFVFVFNEHDLLHKYGEKGDFGTTAAPTQKVIWKNEQ